MTPTAALKTNQIGKELWEVFSNNETLLPLDARRYENEAKKIAKTDPVGAALIRAFLAGITNNLEQVAAEARIASTLGMQDVIYTNFIRLFVNLGQMKQAYALAKEAFHRFPMNLSVSSMFLSLSISFADTENIATALEHWGKMFPGKGNPQILSYAADMALANLEEDDIIDVLNSVSMYSEGLLEPLATKRMEALVDSLLDKVEL